MGEAVAGSPLPTAGLPSRPEAPSLVVGLAGPVLGLLGLHLAALFLLPKTGLGLGPLRPEDFTGAALLAVVVVLAAIGPLPLPRGGLVPVALCYLSYFWMIALLRDVPAGYHQVLVLWSKETSYLVFGYLVWLVNREWPGEFLRLARFAVMPTLAYGAFQIVTGARGIYGVSPFGHESSPASSGMLYFGVSLILWMSGLAGPHRLVRRGLFALSLALVAGSGSKIAVLGAAVFYLVLLIYDGWLAPTPAKVRRLVVAVVGSIVVMSVLTALAFLKLAPSAFGRYLGFLSPVRVLMTRGIWFKFGWLDTPLKIVFGAGYSAGHIVNGQFSYSMATDNQVLFYILTGGVLGLFPYLLLMTTLFRLRPWRSPSGQALRSLTIAYGFMGLGGEVLQLSLQGNVFWMMVGLCLSAPQVEPGRPSLSGAS